MQLALAGSGPDAEETLVASTEICPNDAAAWRELAGLRFTNSRWTDVISLTKRSLSLDPSDSLSWRMLATAHYLAGESDDALMAWNRVGEPRADTITIHGADRTRHPVLVRLLSIAPRQLITPEQFSRAEKRAASLPAASALRLRYEPLDGGRAKLDAYVVERRVLPSDPLSLAALAGRAAFRDEIHAEIAGLLGEGEVWAATWRWIDPRRRLAVTFAFPAPRPLAGIATIDLSTERQTYGPETPLQSVSDVREARRRVGLSLSDWVTSRLWFQSTTALDRFDAHSYLSFAMAVDYRLAGDAVSLSGSGDVWAPLGSGRAFSAARATASWLSTRQSRTPFWSAQSTFAAATGAAPLAVWSGSGTGTGREWLLRAHPLLRDDVLRGAVFGRRLAQGTVEYARPFLHHPLATVAVAFFADAARAWRLHDGTERSRLHVDGGAGLRIQLPGAHGTVRVDAARGFRDGNVAVSVGWIVSPAGPR